MFYVRVTSFNGTEDKTPAEFRSVTDAEVAVHRIGRMLAKYNMRPVRMSIHRLSDDRMVARPSF